ncbi:MAG: DedA family protein [Nocardioidaceae bacterium]
MTALVPLLFGLDWMNPQWLLENFGQEMFWISVVIVFIECGLLFPILPGDTLLFSVGLFIHRDPPDNIEMNIVVACVILSISAFLGNVVGYEIGRKVGPALFQREGRFLNTKNFTKSHEFFELYGNRALVLGRFVPIVRTFITLVAGAAQMDRRRFLTWSAVGAVAWATGLTLLGYFLGGIAFLQHNLEASLILIVVIFTVPIVWEYYRHRRNAARSRRVTAPPETPPQTDEIN